MLQTLNNLAFFEELRSLGIINFFTYDNKFWGNMNLNENKRAVNKFKKIKELFNFPTPFIYLSSNHSDDVQILDNKNILVYKRFSVNQEYKDLVSIKADAIITKEKFPLVINVGDCAVVVITGIDKNDGKRFIIFTHQGLTGTLLGLGRKALENAKSIYSFKPSDLSAFIFPSIIQKHYYYEFLDDDLKFLISSANFDKFVQILDNKYYFDFKGKIIEDLKEFGIKNIFDSGLDTYEENEKGKLFSNTFAKEIKRGRKNRFAVGVAIG